MLNFNGFSAIYRSEFGVYSENENCVSIFSELRLILLDRITTYDFSLLISTCSVEQLTILSTNVTHIDCQRSKHFTPLSLLHSVTLTVDGGSAFHTSLSTSLPILCKV